MPLTEIVTVWISYIVGRDIKCVARGTSRCRLKLHADGAVACRRHRLAGTVVVDDAVRCQQRVGHGDIAEDEVCVAVVGDRDGLVQLCADTRAAERNRAVGIGGNRIGDRDAGHRRGSAGAGHGDGNRRLISVVGRNVEAVGKAPTEPGVKVTLNVQTAAGSTVAPVQVSLVSAKGAGQPIGAGHRAEQQVGRTGIRDGDSLRGRSELSYAAEWNLQVAAGARLSVTTISGAVEFIVTDKIEIVTGLPDEAGREVRKSRVVVDKQSVLDHVQCEDWD